MVGELQRGRLGRGQYVYYHCTGNKGRCPERYTREEVLVARFTEQPCRLRFDPPVLEWITSALRQSHQDERSFHDQAITRLQAEYVQLQHQAADLFEQQASDARPELLKFVVSNCVWQEGRLAVRTVRPSI
jgi:hypothetical protein